MTTETELAIKKLQDEVIDLRKRLESMLSRKGGYIAGSLSYEGDLQPQRNAVSYEGCVFVPLTVPLESVAWDGDSYSTTAKTLIDLSAVFGVPAGAKAIYVQTIIRDSGSPGDYALILGATAVSSVGLYTRCTATPADAWSNGVMIVPCDANGDIYYQIVASGVGTMDVLIQIYGYWL